MLTEEVPDQAVLPPKSRRLDIQGLRAVAVILVVAFHAGLPLPGGFIGVDIFFVVSGFVITGMLLRELERSGTVRFRNFYARRARRLLPALAALITVVAIASMAFASPFASMQTTAKTGVSATFFSANIFILRIGVGYFSPEAANNPLLHTWTLSVEEQFYVLFPMLLLAGWLLGRRLLGRSQRGVVPVLAAVGIASFTLSVFTSFGPAASLVSGGVARRFAFYSSATRAWEFAAGAALALAAPWLAGISRRTSLLLGVGGVCAVAFGAFTISDLQPYPGTSALIPVLGTAAVIGSGFLPSVGVGRLLALRPMVKIGDLSYSWYLWHWPVLVFATAVWPGISGPLLALAAIVSLVPAWLSFTYLENPVRNNESIVGRRLVRLVAGCLVVPVLACAALLAVPRIESRVSDTYAAMKGQVDPTNVSYSRGCAEVLLSESTNPSHCGWNLGANGPHVYLVGDSTAAQYSDGFVEAANTVGSPLTITSASACLFLDATVFFDGVETPGCDRYVRGTTEWLTQQDPGVVVLASAWDWALNGKGVTVQSTPGGPVYASTTQKRSALYSSLEATVSALRAAGHSVVLILPNPLFGQSIQDHWTPNDCPNFRLLLSVADCGATIPEVQAAADDREAIQVLNEVALSTGAETLGVRDRYCFEGLCRTNVGNLWMFRDGIHITVSESEALAPTFAELLKQTAP